MWDALLQPLSRLAEVMDQQWPNILVTLVLILGGWLVARAIRVLLVRGLRIARIDLVAEKAGIEEFLKKGGIRQDAVELLGALVYWIAIIIVIIMVMRVWQIEVGISSQLVPFLPRIFVSLVVLILGLYVASFVGDAVRAAAANTGFAYARVLGKGVHYVLAVLVVLTALRQLGVETELISSGFLMILGAVCLAFGLAFGLGGKEIVAKKLAAYMEEKEKAAKEENRR